MTFCKKENDRPRGGISGCSRLGEEGGFDCKRAAGGNCLLFLTSFWGEGCTALCIVKIHKLHIEKSKVKYKLQIKSI